MKPWEIISLLESDNSRLFKEGVIYDQMINDHVEFFDGVKLCLDSLITFGIKKVPVKKEVALGIFDIESTLDWDEFSTNANWLATREITGNAAIDLVNHMMEKASTYQWNYWYRRILIKDLRCGVSEKTINNVAKQTRKTQFSVPVFTCQLASPSEDHQSKMIGEKIIDVKMDGSRVISVLYPDGRVEQYSRNGKVVDNFPVIREQLSLMCKNLHVPTVFDGEVMSSSFQDLMKQMHRKDNVQTDDAVLHVFDVLPLENFLKGKFDVSQLERRVQLKAFFSDCFEEVKNVVDVDYEIVDLSTEEGKARYQEINRVAVEGGYEGIMIKDPNAAYECKRTTSWLKLKPFITVDLEVIELQEGTGKYEGMLGALICSGVDNDKKITVNVGSGLLEEERKYFWSHKEEILNKTVEIKADAITHSQEQNDDYSLRFPVFLMIRNDK